MSDDGNHPETTPSQPEEQPPSAASSSKLTSGNGFKTIPYMDPEELAELIALGPTTVFYPAKKNTSMRKPVKDETKRPSS